MKILSITLDDNAVPETVTAQLDRKEMQLIAKWAGTQSPAATEEFLPGHAGASSAIYDALVGDVFNRFWDDGVDAAIRGRDGDK